MQCWLNGLYKMTELYDTSWMDNVTNPVNIINGIGSSVGNDFLIGNLLLLGFFVVFLLFSLKFDFLEVLAIDCFLTTFFGILAAYAGIVSFVTPVFPFVVFCITLIFMFMNR